MYIKPSEIRFSQDSIGCTFGRRTSHPFRHIGNTLDDILSGRCNISCIPSISVVNKNGLWFTTDNRRLWVFQEAEKRGKCDEIYVRETIYIDYSKFTTMNNGISVYVRGDPGGSLWRSMPEVNRRPKEPSREISTIYSESFTRTNTKINTEVSTRQMDQDVSALSRSYRQHSLVNTNLVFPKPLEDDSSETSSDCEQNDSADVRQIEEIEVDYAKHLDSLSDVSGNKHDEVSSTSFSSNTCSICLPLPQSDKFPNFGVLKTDDMDKISMASTEGTRGITVETKTVVEVKVVVEDIKSKDDTEKEETIDDDNGPGNEIESKISNPKIVTSGKESLILNMEGDSENPTKKRICTKRIICVSSITIALLIVIPCFIYILLSVT